MKKYIYSLAIFLLAVTCNAQQVQWAKKYPKLGQTTAPEFLESSPVSGTAVAGEYSTGDSIQGAFLYKLNSTGNIVWGDTLKSQNPASSPGIGDFVRPSGMAFESGGKLFFAGNFSDTMNIDGTTFLNTGEKNSFLIRYNSSGGKDWIKTYPNAYINDVHIDGSDNLYILISFSGTLVFYGQTFTSLGASDLIIAKIDPSDNLVFSKQLHGNINGIKIKTAASGNVYLLGNYSDTLYYDAHQYASSGPFGNYFVLKTNPLGNQLYYIPLFSSQQENATDLDINSNERSMVTGKYCWTDGCHGIVRSYDASGNLLSGQTILGSTCDYGCEFDMQSIVVTDTAGVWGIGHEWNTLNYGIPEDDWVNLGLTKFDFMGNILMHDTILISHITDFRYKDIAADNAHNIYITSQLYDTIHIGSYTLINNGADPGFFVAKFNQMPVTTGIANAAFKNAFEIYPNPALGVFNVRYNCEKINCIKLTVRNALGEIVFTDEKKGSGNNYNRQIDLRTQPKGIYFFELNNGSEREVKKVILN